MAKLILTIGYRSFLLPNDTGVTTLLNVLDRSQPCKYNRYQRPIPEIELLEDDPVTVEVELLPRNVRTIGKPKRRRLPSAAGPDAHGADFTTPED